MSDSVTVAVISGIAGFVIGGFFVDTTGEALGVVAVITALSTATAREGAVLARRSEKAIKRITAIGFFVGLAISVLVLGADAIWG